MKNRNILLGVTGGIEVYKALELTRLFTKAGVAQSHAGAMIRNEEETYAAKRAAMEDAGVTVVERPDAVFAQTAKILSL